MRNLHNSAVQGKRKQRARALKLIRSLNDKPKTRSGCEYGSADVERVIQVKAAFPDIFRKAASDRLRIAVERAAWSQEEGMILMQRGVSVPPWMEDLWAVTNPKTPIKTLRAAGARLHERIKEVDIPTLAGIFEPPKKQGPQSIEETTLRRIKLIADLEYERISGPKIAGILFQHLPANAANLSDTVVADIRYDAMRKFKSQHRRRIEARLNWRKLHS